MKGNDISELTAIDYAFGAFIIKTFDGVSADSGSQHFQAFMKRPAKEKIFRGDFQEPKEFLKKLQRYMSHKEGTDKRARNQPVLPAIYYHRSLEFATAEPDAGNLVLSDVIWTGQDKKKAILASMAKLNLSYKVVFIATDRPTVERMALAWYFNIANTKKGGHRFPVTYNIAGNPMEFACLIQDAKTLQIVDLSVPESEQRLFALECDYEVEAPVLYGENVKPVESIRWKLSLAPGFKGCHSCG